MSASVENSPQKIRVGLVGCGRVAEHHLRFINEMEGAEVAGLADVNEASARRLGEKYGVQNLHGSLEALLASTPLDVLHVATPPAQHYPHARLAIDQGVSVLLEKPMTLCASEAVDLYDRAAAKGVSLCPDFIMLFHPHMQRTMAMIDRGELGQVIHCESYLCLDPNPPEARESKRLPWSYDLPGGIFHDSITHLLYLVLNWVGTPRRVIAIPKSLGSMPQNLTDHLEIVLEGEHATGHITMSAATKPRYYYIRLFCEKGTVLVDFHTMTIMLERRSRLPGSVARMASNFRQAYQLSRGTLATIVAGLRGKLVPYHGLRLLLPKFYESVASHGPAPISRALALAVSATEDSVFAQGGKFRLDLHCRRSAQCGIKHPERLLVTGAAGYIGSEVVRQLVEEGYYVRALVRPLSRTDALERLGVELVYGDVREREDLFEAARGADVIVHLAAGLRGTRDFVIDSSVTGTRNVAEAAQAHGVGRVIYVSSMGIYDFAALPNRTVIREGSPLEGSPELRGAATLAKRQAEDIALAHLADRDCPWTIIRPSFVFGNGRDILSPLGFRVGRTVVCLTRASNHMALIHVRDVATAILRLVQNTQTSGSVFNLSHPDSLTVRAYVNEGVRKTQYRNVHVLYVPRWIACCGAAASGILHRITGRGPHIRLRQLAIAYRDRLVDSSAIMARTGWRPQQALLDQVREQAQPEASEVCQGRRGAEGASRWSSPVVSSASGEALGDGVRSGSGLLRT